jgi:predicted nucleotidyltransferase component of viral defense system
LLLKTVYSAWESDAVYTEWMLDMDVDQRKQVEAIQRMVARCVAIHPAGRNLLLIGGFRYRFLDESVRTSDDIDYHWSGDLGEKQKELVSLLTRVLLPEVRRRFGYAGAVGPRTGPDADSPAVRIVDLAFWREAVSHSRLEIPIELTRIVCADPITVRTVGGTIYPTVSEADMIESKVIALFNRRELRHRDMVDIFLFQDRLARDFHVRLKAKLRTLHILPSAVEQRITDLRQHGAYHARAIQEVIDTQLDPSAAAQMNEAGGGRAILEAVLAALADRGGQDR